MNVIFYCHHISETDKKSLLNLVQTQERKAIISINDGKYKRAALSALHLLAEKDGRALREPELDLAALFAAARRGEEHTAADVAL